MFEIGTAKTKTVNPARHELEELVQWTNLQFTEKKPEHKRHMTYYDGQMDALLDFKLEIGRRLKEQSV